MVALPRQVNSGGEATFRSDGAGGSGSATFQQPGAQVEAPYDDLQRAAEVIVGRLEVQELTGGRSRADLVIALLIPATTVQQCAL